MMEVFIKRYVQYWYPGTFVSDTEERELKDGEQPTLEGNAYAYQTFERQCVKSADGEVLTGEPRNHSKQFIKGVLWDIDDAKRLGTPTLVSNMRISKWEHVVKCSQGCIPYRHDSMELLESAP